ncbi:bacillithiol biosynthesis cysteine-adding enzyme BshC [Lihuaxuella thermophila]|uniref:Putative cysteine ligase BshC n=1 Tax=Lihuaxuella thermophila TaxID=1173111 RepID=A0A1H8DMF5_9BACL|nr:bacillithiol biosynthesis cysteine-adding enzyme BshC [Lihuaxuella thermophila]SEN08335.1 bacillithiol biosynthesis cysteine-adding enzyme BshC [Lihuaxuella thermophila]
MKIDAVSYPGSNPITHDYLQPAHPIHSFFSYHPMNAESFVQRAKWVDGRKEQYSRARLVEVLRSYHQPELDHPAIQRNLERLSEPDSLVVIGGQQAGLLTGPLYTLYKAVTIIQLAEREQERLNRPVIPVFWIAGEDHDRNEVDHVWIQTSEGVPVKHRFSSGDEKKRPVSSLYIKKEEMERWLDELGRILPDREYKKEWAERLKKWTNEPVTWSRFFARVMHHLFADRGLLMIDSAYPELRRMEAPFFKHLIKINDSIHSRVMETAEELKKLGYPVAVDLKKNQAHLFVQVEDERLSLVRDQGLWRSRDGRESFSDDELLSLAEQEPERLSNNVITRPLMQEYLFPTLAFVGGPGEISYWALLKQAFEEAGFRMPVVYPRLRMTLIDRTAYKRMQEFGLTWSDLFTRFGEKKEEWLADRQPFHLDDLFLPVKEQIIASYQPLIRLLSEEIGMDLYEMGQKNQQKILEQVDYFYNYTKRSIENKYRTELRHWEEISNTCLPLDKLQERVYNLVNYWNEYGLSWLSRLLETPLLTGNEEFEHRCIIL